MTTFILSSPESRFAVILGQMKRKYREDGNGDGHLGEYKDII